MYPTMMEIIERESWVIKALNTISDRVSDCPKITKFLNQELLVLQELKELYSVGGFI